MFVDSFSDSIGNAINQLGGPKKVGLMLWPEKSAREAGNQLLNCLNPDHQQKLSLEQIDLIICEARKNSIHDIHKYMCDRYGYEFKPITKESIKADIQKQMNAAITDIRGLLEKWEQIK